MQHGEQSAHVPWSEVRDTSYNLMVGAQLLSHLSFCITMIASYAGHRLLRTVGDRRVDEILLEMVFSTYQIDSVDLW